MNELKTNVNDIKSVAKILKKELALMDFELSHSSALNLASRSLGFKNYQTYKNLSTTKKEHFEWLKNLALTQEDFKGYSKINNNFIQFSEHDEYFTYIDRELSGIKYNYFLIYQLKESYTKRVFFLPQYDIFSFFVYPNIENPTYDYHIKLENMDKKNNFSDVWDMIKHVNGKNWMNREILGDLLILIEKIKKDRKNFLEEVNKYSNQELERLYKEEKND